MCHPLAFSLSQGPVALRPLGAADAPTLLRWLTDPRVLEYWEGPSAVFTPQRIQGDFYEDPDPTSRCVVQWEGQDVGYVQAYPLDGAGLVEYDLAPTGETVWGLDQFIAEPDLWGKGVGRRFLRLLCGHLFSQQRVNRIVLDPHVDNERAIRCYEACGFRKQKLLPRHEMHDGVLVDCRLMACTPASFVPGPPED